MACVSSRTARPRSRTFTGCLTCRSRKVKCDLGRPDCANCQRLNIDCPGYGAVLSWMPAWISDRDDPPGKAAYAEQQAGRRPRAEPLSEYERQIETAKLLQHLASIPICSDIDVLLDRLEQEASREGERLARDFDFQVEVGPYTVFSTGSSVAAESPLSGLLGMADPGSFPASENTHPCAMFAPDFLYGTDPDHNQRRSRVDLPTGSGFTGDDGMILGAYDAMFPVDTPRVATGPLSYDMPEFLMLSDTELVPTRESAEIAENVDQMPMPPNSPSTRLSNGSPYLPADVRFLLHHYDTQVIDSLSALPIARDKAPWRGLHLPSALRAYGELDILGTSSLARVSLLYSLLSLTCYHLSSLYTPVGVGTPLEPAPNTETEEHWKRQAQKFRGIGRTAFRKHLESEPLRKGKYKESLMAAMSLVCIGIVAGDPWDARVYIRQSESIIRTGEGLKQRFSERALQLHRIFAFVKIMEQSTFCHSQSDYVRVLESNDILPSEVALVKEAAETDHHGDELVVRCPVADETRLAASHLQLDLPADEGFNNLYGASGKLLEMLIATNALVNRISSRSQLADGRPSRYAVLPEDLLGEAADLEQSICDWASDPDALPCLPNLIDPGHDLPWLSESDLLVRDDATATMASCMRVAFYYALLVYFFREVRNTNPKILQHYVRKAVACLESHQAAKTRFYPGKRIGTIVWPSFIVACEALDPDLRRRAVLCIRYSAAAGFRNGETAEAVVREVWRRRDSVDAGVSWRDVVRQLKAFMLLS